MALGPSNGPPGPHGEGENFEGGEKAAESRAGGVSGHGQSSGSGHRPSSVPNPRPSTGGTASPMLRGGSPESR